MRTLRLLLLPLLEESTRDFRRHQMPSVRVHETEQQETVRTEHLEDELRYSAIS